MAARESASIASPARSWFSSRGVTAVGLYVVGLTAVAWLLIALCARLQFSWSVLDHFSEPEWILGLLFFVAVAIFAERFSVPIGNTMEVDATFLAFFLSAATLGPLAACVVAIGSQLWQLKSKDLERVACYSSVFAVAAAGAAIVYWTFPWLTPVSLPPATWQGALRQV